MNGWFQHPFVRHAYVQDTVIGEMMVVRPHKSKKYIVKHRGVEISRTLHDTPEAARQAADDYVRSKS